MENINTYTENGKLITEIVEISTIEEDAVKLATLLDELISVIPFTAWPHVHKELKGMGWTKDYLKKLRDRYADRYRNI